MPIFKASCFDINFLEVYNENIFFIMRKYCKEGNDMFNIGDRVLYPMHGAGVIEEVEEHEVLGEAKSYFVLKMPIGSIKIMIPVSGIENLGVRYVMEADELNNVLNALRIEHKEENANWNKRYRENMVRIKSGNIYEVADVYKSLICRDKGKGLSTGERKMLANARQILFSEIMLSCGLEIEQVDQLISEAISDYLKEYNLKIGG